MEIFVLGDIWKKGTEPRTVRHTCTDIFFYPLSPSKASGFCELQCRPLNMEAVMTMVVVAAGIYLCILLLFIYYTLCANYQDGIVT